MRRWILLHYRLPPIPSAGRVAVWRKLKQLGALLIHDSVWVLPDTAWTTEQLQWLATEIDERHGDAFVWHAQGLMPDQDAGLRDRFLAASEAEYHGIIEDLRQEGTDRIALAKRHQQAHRRDYFECPLGPQIYEALIRAEED